MNPCKRSKMFCVLSPLMCALLAHDSVCYRALAEQTNVTLGSRTLPMAKLGQPNPWPRFRFQIPDAPVRASDELSEDDRAGMFTNAAVPPLPYLMQDNYDRDRSEGQLPVITLENAALRATFYPTLGGRLISLYDRRNDRELLFNNPVFQPANLAIRNAWFSGGVEWNGPLYGHSLLTCSPVFAATVATPKGPLLRLYEFDRALETTWQVDAFLPSNEDRLWVHIKAINPNSHPISFYWWTNLAVPLVPGTRVLSPADYALSHDSSGNSRLPFPVFDGFDGSYPLNYPYAKSVFFRKPDTERPWSAYVDGSGHGLSHVSTQELFGRKLFTWGTGRGGKRWMDFLSADGQGDYIEIQGGVTPTQLQTRPLAAGGQIEWTECISPLALDKTTAHDPDYSAACAAAGEAIERNVPRAELCRMDGFLRLQADTPVNAVLRPGAGWGWLYEQRTGRKISPGLRFDCALNEEERPWAELLASGTFSPETLGKPPSSFNTSAGWTAVLRKSATRHGATWLHYLHLGVAEMEAGQFDEAGQEFQKSIALKQNAHAQRNLALLDERHGLIESSQAAYQRAWQFSHEDRNLAVEICEFLQRHFRFDDFDTFVQSLPDVVSEHERIALARARIALARDNCSEVRRLLRREFATIREGEVSLSELWFASHIKEAERCTDRPLTPSEIRHIIQDSPPPRAIDFRMK